MKHWTILLTLLLLVGCERVYEGELVERRGIYYVPTETEPFTGSSIEYRRNGELASEGVYKDGKEVRTTLWWDNGILRAETHYQNGEFDGEFKTWHRNGEPKTVFNYKNGRPHGLQREWHDNGQQALEVEFSDGEQLGARTIWTKEGERSFVR